MNTFDLDLIAARLEALEETIIHRFIDRAQFAHNEPAYLPRHSGFAGAEESSLFQVRLEAQERLDAEFGRYVIPEERPYTTGLPEPRRQVVLSDTGIARMPYDCINQTAHICSAYLNCLMALCPPGDDGQHGSSVEHDVSALQAIARRVHYGALYVAESKYRRSPEVYRELIQSGNAEELLRLLTRPEVEDAVVRRLAAKVEHLQAHVNRSIRRIVEPELLVKFYRDIVIPLTKAGQVAYLLRR
ncbi:MAG: chorismate mutase [Spirochaetaceae bacterium]|nr:MAG: chorismate mutase [Spirochaetaceae bacterium]